MANNDLPLDIEYQNSHYWNSLMLTARYNYDQIARLLARQNPQPSPNKQNEKGETAVIIASKYGSSLVLDILLTKLRADVNMLDNNNTSAVLWAAKRGNWSVVRTLVNKRAIVEQPNNDDQIALQFAIRSKNQTNVWRIVRADRMGRSLTVFDNQGRTPLHIAAETGDINIILLLLNVGANKLSTDIWGRTPAQTAWGRGYIQAAGILT